MIVLFVNVVNEYKSKKLQRNVKQKIERDSRAALFTTSSVVFSICAFERACGKETQKEREPRVLISFFFFFFFVLLSSSAGRSLYKKQLP